MFPKIFFSINKYNKVRYKINVKKRTVLHMKRKQFPFVIAQKMQYKCSSGGDIHSFVALFWFMTECCYKNASLEFTILLTQCLWCRHTHTGLKTHGLKAINTAENCWGHKLKATLCSLENTMLPSLRFLPWLTHLTYPNHTHKNIFIEILMKVL